MSSLRSRPQATRSANQPSPLEMTTRSDARNLQAAAKAAANGTSTNTGANGQKRNPLTYQFATSTQDILRKYAKYPPSLTFHIYESHYKFNNSQDSQILPKNSPMVKSFLQHIVREQIPSEMSELIKDFSIRSYDGCLILQVYDHRNMISSETGKPVVPTKEDPSEKRLSPLQQSPTTAPASNGSSSTPAPASKPKTYRALLRPTPLSLYYDLLYHTDSALTKFSDPLALQMESEILTLTNRKLDLAVPLNPYNCGPLLKPDVDSPKVEWDEKLQDYKMVHSHRKEVARQPRKLHQDELVLHKSSEYEEIMFLLSNKHKKTDETLEKHLVVVGPSALTGTVDGPDKSKSSDGGLSSGTAAVVASANANTSSTANTTGQFMRLRFIEEIRKRREAQKAQHEANVAVQAQNNVMNVIGQNAPTSDQKPNVAKPPSIPGSSQQQILADKAQALRAQQLHAQQQQQQQRQRQQQLQQQMQTRGQIPNKRQRVDVPMSQQAQQMPQMNSQMASQMNSQSPSNMGTPVMNGNMYMQQQQQQQQQQAVPRRVPQQANMPQLQQPPQQTQQRPLSGMQQQQQQLFQSLLSPQEQQTFRQLQSRMNALAMMGNTGMAANRTPLNPQQQQQALQQAKLIQQQLLQTFPAYFQRLRQLQIIQQRQKQQQQLQQQQQQRPNGPMGLSPPQQMAQQSNMGGMQQQQYLNQRKNG